MKPRIFKKYTRRLKVTQIIRNCRMWNKKSWRVSIPLGHSFDAKATIKEAADKMDKFLIFSAEDGRLSRGENTFVFRSSREKVKMMFEMQRGSGGPWEEQYCFLDAEYDWVQKMKTINLSVEHPALKERVTLASMDCQSESTNTLSEFWSKVNNVSIWLIKCSTRRVLVKA